MGAPYVGDTRDKELRIVRFLDHIKHDAETIYLLGDILDYWYEYRYVVPRGYVRFFGKLAELSDAGIKIVWLKGNHDIWIYDYLPQELGIEVRDGSLVKEIYGKKVFMNHGDGVGNIHFSFKIIRTLFRNRVCQWLFSGIHPRWTVPFAYSWSAHSRKTGDDERYSSEKPLDNLKRFAESYLLQHPDINYFIFGHIHVLWRDKIAPDCEIIVLGEWLKSYSYAKLGPEGLELLKWE